LRARQAISERVPSGGTNCVGLTTLQGMNCCKPGHVLICGGEAIVQIQAKLTVQDGEFEIIAKEEKQWRSV
jgi:hypothetical protein